MRAATASPGLPTPSPRRMSWPEDPRPLLPAGLTRFLNRAVQQFPGMLFSRGTVLLMISPVLSLPGKSESGSSQLGQEWLGLESTG